MYYTLSKILKKQICLAWRLSVDPMPFDGVIDMTSVSIKPHIVVWNIHYLVTFWHKPLKCVVSVNICNDRQSWILSRTKLSRFIPTQHWTISVETMLLFIVHWVTLGECRYDSYGVQQNQCVSYTTVAFTITRFSITSNIIIIIVIIIMIIIIVIIAQWWL